MPDAKASIDAYIAAAPPRARQALKTIRATVKAVAPDAVEGFGYGIPGAKLDGRVLIYYAAWSDFCSMYPITASIQRTHALALKGRAASKGTVRFPLDRPVPVTLVRTLVKARIAEVRARERLSRESGQAPRRAAVPSRRASRPRD